MDSAPVTVAVLDEDGHPVSSMTFHVPSEVMQSFGAFVEAQNEGKETPVYSGVWDMIVKHFVNSLVLPLLKQYPPPALAAIEAQARAAASAADAAKAAIVASLRT